MKPSGLFSILLVGMLFTTLAHAALPAQVIRNKGSDTMYKVAVTWAETYQLHNRNLDQTQTRQDLLRGHTIPLAKVEVQVTGGGSTNGIAALINGHVEIANSSRAIREKELNLSQRLDQQKPVGTIVGWDAVVIMVHESNPIEGLTLAHLRDIFEKDGKITHWSQLRIYPPQCPRDEIKLIGRKNNSGTYMFLREHMGSDRLQFHTDMDNLDYSREVVNHTANTPCAISYAGMAYITDGVKLLCLMLQPGSTCVYPSVPSVADRTYPLARPLYMYTLGDPQGHIRDYLDWIRGPEGQKILKNAGYIPLLEGPPVD